MKILSFFGANVPFTGIALGDENATAVPISSSNPLPTAAAALPASGVDAVTGTLDAVEVGAEFEPAPGRDFNITVSGTFVATIVVERSFDSGATWHAKWPSGVYSITDPRSFADSESEAGVVYRLNCTAWSSGTATYRMSQ